MRWSEIIKEWQKNAPIKQITDTIHELDNEMDPNRGIDLNIDETEEIVSSDDEMLQAGAKPLVGSKIKKSLKRKIGKKTKSSWK